MNLEHTRKGLKYRCYLRDINKKSNVTSQHSVSRPLMVYMRKFPVFAGLLAVAIAIAIASQIFQAVNAKDLQVREQKDFELRTSVINWSAIRYS